METPARDHPARPKARSLTRRGALTGATSLPLVHIRTAGAAGKLSMVVPDHWIEAGNVTMREQIQTWAETNKVDVKADFLGGQAVLNTRSAQAMAKSGHDVQVFPVWEVHNNAGQMIPMDDVMGTLTAQYGPTNEICEYLGKVDGQWRAVPISTMSFYYNALGRISLLRQAGLDVLDLYPARDGGSPSAETWNYDTYLRVAEASHKMGLPFATGLGTTSDCTGWVGQMFASFGAELIDRNGAITVDSDPVRRVLEYSQKLVKFLPANAVAYDDASNNRAYISGKTTLIFNPPSPWWVARKDTPEIANDSWIFPAPAGPAGRFEAYSTNYWGIWTFAQNKSAAKDIIAHLMQRRQVEERGNAVVGYDIPPFASMAGFPIWDQAGPPAGLCYNYPLRPFHKARPYIAMSPAPPAIAVRAFTRGTLPSMLARLHAGQTIPQVITWVEDELAGFIER